MTEPRYPTLDEWEHSGVITVSLDAVGDTPACDVDFQLPDLQQFIAAGSIPGVLVGIAIRVETEGVDEEAEMLKPEDFARYLDLQYHIIASNLRRPDLVAELGSLEAATAWVRDKMPGLHRYQLWRRAMHLDMNLGGLQRAMRSVEDLAGFRDGLAGADVPEGERAVDALAV